VRLRRTNAPSKVRLQRTNAPSKVRLQRTMDRTCARPRPQLCSECRAQPPPSRNRPI